jgi:hypothetical protein
MTKDEALQLALDSMKEIIHWYAVRDRNDVFLNFVDQNPEIQKIMKAITAIKEALETKDEPVAWEQFHEHMAGPNYVAPQRTWVGLTKEDLKLLSAEWRIFYGVWMDDFARDIEAKLKEKNT